MTQNRRRNRELWHLRRFHVRVMTAVSAATALAVFASAGAVWHAEKESPRANITGFWDAVWWAMETITTVGYGDRHPTTGLGRLVAGGLMIVGVALVGVITATVVTWFFSELDVLREVQGIEEAEERTETALREVLSRLEETNLRLERLEDELSLREREESA